MRKPIFLLLFFCFLIGAAQAANYYVYNTSSEVTTENSLSWAVAQANLSEGPHYIYFSVPATVESGFITHEATGAQFWRIKPSDSLALSRNRIIINGSTQTTNQGNTNPYGPEIEISGEDITGVQSLISINNCNWCTIEGVAIIKSKSHGIYLNASNYAEIIGDYIGIFATGEAEAGNDGHGVYVNAGTTNVIGGPLAALRCVISGNTGDGIRLYITDSTQIKGNYIGTNWNGRSALGNTGNGIYIDNYVLNVIGGGGAGEANYVSGNTQNGIVVNGTLASGNTMLGNYIGLSTAEADLGNGANGILAQSGANLNTMGANNRIAYNASDGIEINGSATLYNYLTQNSLYANTEKGINLASGGNASLSVATITTAEYYSYSDQTYVLGGGAASRTIELFKSDGTGEGKTYLGSTVSNTAGEWAAYVSNLATGEGVTAASTDAGGNTSEFADEVTTVYAGDTEYRPDGIIGNQVDDSDYIGEGTFNASGTDQTKRQSISVGQTATYYIKVKNAGNAAEYISALGDGDSTGWTVTYYDAKTGGGDITSQVTGSVGWPADLGIDETTEIRAVVRSTAGELSTKEVYVTAVSATNPNKRDVVGAITTASIASSVGSFSISAPTTASAEVAFSATITARNAVGEVTTEVKTVYLSTDAGTVSPASIAASYFIDDGIWTGSVTLSRAGTRTLTATAEDSSATGSATIVVSCATTEYSNSTLGVIISIPAGAADEEVNVSAAEGSSLPGAAPSGYRQAGKIIVITSSVTNFLLPVTVTIPLYSQAPDPQVYYWDGSGWSQSGIVRISYTTSAITFTTTHLSTFVPFSQVTSGAISFGPNPYNPNSGTNAAFWYWLDADQATSLYIFDAAGNQIFRETYLPGSNGGRAGANIIGWSGRNSWNEVLDNGVYPYRLVQEGKAVAKGKLIILRR